MPTKTYYEIKKQKRLPKKAFFTIFAENFLWRMKVIRVYFIVHKYHLKRVHSKNYILEQSERNEDSRFFFDAKSTKS